MIRALVLHCSLVAACVVGCILTPMSAVLAAELTTSEIRGTNKKKPETVLQNRYFVKTLRPEVGFVVGTFINEAYTDTSIVGGRLGLFFNEWVGMEAQFIQASARESDDLKALHSLTYRDATQDVEVHPDPSYNPIKGAKEVTAVTAPFYGKLNLLDRFVVYSDVYLTGGFGQVETEQGTKSAFVIGMGQRFYMLEKLSLRLDCRDRLYSEERDGSSTQKNAISIDFGASYFFM